MIVYEKMPQTLIPNTIMKKIFIDNIHKAYSIQPLNGYVLHDNTMDIDIIDEITFEIIGKKFGYSPSNVDVTCGVNYDFISHIITDENGNICTAYGDRDFFTVPA